MSSPVERFDSAIYAIRDSGLEPFSTIAGRSVQRIVRREVSTTLNFTAPRIRAATVFGLVPIPDAPKHQHFATIMMELSDLMSMDNRMLQGDLIRTLAVFDRYPFNGYEGRLRGVYEQALDTQRDWLTQTNTPEIPYDPRSMDKKNLMRHLMGQAKYNLDIGFEDWVAGIDLLVGSNLTPDDDKEILEKYRDAKEHFIVQRHMHQLELYKKMVSMGVFDSYSEDNLRQYFATTLLGGVVLSELADQKKQKSE